MNQLQLIAIFCDIDDFGKQFEPIYQQHLLQPGNATDPCHDADAQ